MYPVKKIPFPLTIIMIYILLHSLQRVPLQVNGNCIKGLKAGCGWEWDEKDLCGWSSRLNLNYYLECIYN